jgi:hypothetical protein
MLTVLNEDFFYLFLEPLHIEGINEVKHIADLVSNL